MAYQMARLPMIMNGVTFAVLNFCNTHNSGNVACFNYSVFTHKLKSALGLGFKYCQR